MNNEIDIFSNTKPQSGEFFKFKNVGDSIQGTYIDVKDGTDSFGNDQTIYVIQDAAKKVWNLGFRKTSLVIHERMKSIRFGQIVGFRFDEERESKKSTNNKAKIIRIYADPKFVDAEWIKQQEEIEKKFAGMSGGGYTGYTSQPASPYKEEGGINVKDIFKAPEDSAPAGGSLPSEKVKPRNEALDAIRNLAKTKGLTNESMSEEDADEVIEKYTGFILKEENLTKIIISLTGFARK